jgi:transketolase
MASGSEVAIALEARESLEASGVPTRVVSMPCMEWFDAQPLEYQHSVLPPHVTARVSVEAGLALSWHKYLGTSGRAISLEHFGASADYQTLYREFGLTAQDVVDTAHTSAAAAAEGTRP